jgi:hypothetical protein
MVPLQRARSPHVDYPADGGRAVERTKDRADSTEGD